MWRTNALRVGSPPEVGAQVFVFGTPTIWEERGEFRLTCTEMLVTERLGLEHLELREDQGRAGEGRIVRSRRGSGRCPQCPPHRGGDQSGRRRIAGHHHRGPEALAAALELLVIGAKVQGAEAESEMVRALQTGQSAGGQSTLCIVARGGGAREDLAVFNSEAVCRALARVRGAHHLRGRARDRLSVHRSRGRLRAATPSAAMELAVPDRAELIDRVNASGCTACQRGGAGHPARSRALERTGDRLQSAVTKLLNGGSDKSSGWAPNSMH